MSEQMMPLRQRMIDDMALRNMSPGTKNAYVRAVKNLSRFFRRSLDKLTFEDVRKYQLHLVSRGLKAATIIPIMCALRFFYGTTLGRSDVAEHIPLARKADTLPAVLSQDEVVRFLKAVPDLRYRTLFVAIYAAGLRVSEAVALTIKDIDSTRMVVRIRQGKGRKDRYVMLSEQLLGLLRDYWKRERPLRIGSFPGPTLSGRSRRALCNAPVVKPSTPPVSTRLLRFTHCDIALPPICWSRASISGSSRTYSVTATSHRQPAILAWPST